MVSISPQTSFINEGEFVEVTIILKPTVGGTQSFNINTIIDGESYDQLVSVTMPVEEIGFLTRIGNSINNNTTLYRAAGIVGLLIILVLVLIIKVSKKKANPQF